MTLVLLLLAIVIAAITLTFERLRLDRCRSGIPLIISVTGTRGKSSVTRLIASVLREDGRRVLAKTTGSEAAYILPDGSEQTIQRRGRPSIMEQKRLIHMGAAMGVDAVVAEAMSIHAENHIVEARQLLQPDMVLVTNFRVDHTAAMGTTPTDVARVLALDVVAGAEVFVSERQLQPIFRQAIQNRHDPEPELIAVPADTGAASLGNHSLPGEFSENLDLVITVARSLEIGTDAIRAGIAKARRDIGALTAWRYRPTEKDALCLLINAFAANDPESTGIVYHKVLASLNRDPSDCIGLLNLRQDRADRTVQWAEAMADRWLHQFKRLYVCGLHAAAFKRRLRQNEELCEVEVLRSTQPAAMTRTILSGIHKTGGLVFGFGNVGEVGKSLISHWREVGEPLEI